MARHHLLLHRPPRHTLRGGKAPPVRTSDMVLALLSVVLLGGFALAAALVLTLGPSVP